ncbi:MAG TPA: allophanate hydrolase subunit 1 [Candidatus Limnocylindrales bacterium]|nr:allophanate hydrolase subunit 1 [Candidatus Limnocylindrales bacterium]
MGNIPRIRFYGWDSLLVEVDDPAGWFRALTAARSAGGFECEEIVPAARTVLLRGVTSPPDFERLQPLPPSTSTKTVTIPVTWIGEDLDAVASLWGEDPVARMAATPFTVAFCGFAPGFAYLSGLPPHCRVSRLDTPRTSVPAGSVAVAGEYAGVYPRSSPGGWRLLGHTDVALFDLERDPPALLTPGTTVRFANA